MSLYSIVWVFMVMLWGCSREQIQPMQNNHVERVSLLSCKYLGSVHRGGTDTSTSCILQCKGHISGFQSKGSLAIIALPSDVPFRQSYIDQALKLKEKNIEKGFWGKEKDMFVFWKKGYGGCAENLIWTLGEEDYKTLVNCKKPYYIYMLFVQETSPVRSYYCSYEPVLIDSTLNDNTVDLRNLHLNFQKENLKINDINGNYNIAKTDNNCTISYLASASDSFTLSNDTRVGFILVNKGTEAVDAFRRVISSGKSYKQATLFKDVIFIPGTLKSDKIIQAEFIPKDLPINYTKVTPYVYIEQNNSYVFFDIGQVEFNITNAESSNSKLNITCTCTNFSVTPSMQWVTFKRENESSVLGDRYILILKKGPSWDLSKIEDLFKKVSGNSNKYVKKSDDDMLLLLKGGVGGIYITFKDFFQKGMLDYKYTICTFSKENKLEQYTDPKELIVSTNEWEAIVDNPTLVVEPVKKNQLKLEWNLYSNKFREIIHHSKANYRYGFLISTNSELTVEEVQRYISSNSWQKNGSDNYVVGVYNEGNNDFDISNITKLKKIVEKISKSKTKLKIAIWAHKNNNLAKGIICSEVKELSIKWNEKHRFFGF